MSGAITLRPATGADGPDLWRWRNDAGARAMSLSRDPIALADHLSWFAAALGAADRQILIAERDGAPFGMVRFDDLGDVVLTSIALAPETRGRGLARPVLAQALARCRFERPIFRAMVRRGNDPSLALFTGLGFRMTEDGDPIVLDRPKGNQDA